MSTISIQSRFSIFLDETDKLSLDKASIINEFINHEMDVDEQKPIQMSHIMKKKNVYPYANNKGADQPSQSDQYLCYSLPR